MPDAAEVHSDLVRVSDELSYVRMAIERSDQWMPREGAEAGCERALVRRGQLLPVKADHQVFSERPLNLGEGVIIQPREIDASDDAA
jgi:hypothetical protein